MKIEQALAIVETRSKGRTRFQGQEPFIDEVLAQEVLRLQSLVEDQKVTLEGYIEMACTDAETINSLERELAGLERELSLD